jgi:hypothetical protein
VDPWPLVRRFFDHLEANADEYGQVPSVGPEELPMPREADQEEEHLYGAAYEGVTYRDTTGDDEEGAVMEGAPRDEFLLESQAEAVTRRLHFLTTVARLWQLAVRQPGREGHADAVAGWLASARERQQRLLKLLDAIQGCRVPEPSGSPESVLDYDRRRVLKERLLDAAIDTCLETSMAVGTLHAALGREEAAPAGGRRPEWEPGALRLEQAVLAGDAAEARAALPRFLELFRGEPLLFVPLAEGGEPRFILRARTAQTILQTLAATLPHLGLYRETFHLLRAAWEMEQANPVGAHGVTEFGQLFETAFRATAENLVESAEAWEAHRPTVTDEELAALLETVTRPFLALWVGHSLRTRLSRLEAVADAEEWQALVNFVRRYGHDLFHANFMRLGNLRGILLRGVAAHVDYLCDNPDPLHPVKLVEDLENGLPREPALRRLGLVLQAVVENYEEYLDYNTTVARSDYGENLYVLLDFLRLKASYGRFAWQLRPLVLAHEVLARLGRDRAAVLWEEAVGRQTEGPAAEHLQALARLEQTHGVRLATVGDRVRERFVKPLALDRLCALVEPAMEEARGSEPAAAFGRLREELAAYVATPVGAGLDVPGWLRRLGAEVQRVRAGRTTLAVLAGRQFHLPERRVSLEDLQGQLRDWDKPL